MTEEMLCKNLLLGISGSIHAVDAHQYLLFFRQHLAQNIKVVMTRQAAQMVSPQTLALYADDRVFVEVWDQSPEVNKAAHLQLTRWADLFVIIPATADIIGKAANGIADDLLSTCILSYPRTIVFAPVMNVVMFQSKALQRNLKTLEADGHYIVMPEALGMAVGTGDWAHTACPTPETALLHLRHIRMKQLKDDYWEEATREKPMTPSERKKQYVQEIKQKIQARREAEQAVPSKQNALE
ncbi:MAG: hypothetical protein JO202_04900 [Ktedonobacteraceae bacterium]|nr:hypothetical protein [Ktedonobacteraceae bacterium]